jgi:hypothetical protein
MIAADSAVQRPADAKLLVVDAQRNIIHVPRSAFVEFLRPNDLVIANDAANCLPVLQACTINRKTDRGTTCRTSFIDPMDVSRFSAVVFGEGDFHARTEDRPLPPPLQLRRYAACLVHCTQQLKSCWDIHDSFPFSFTAVRTTSGRVWRVTANRFSIHTCRRLWSCGTFGPESPAAGGFRAAFGRFRSRLAGAVGHPRTWRTLRDRDSRRGHLIDRRRRSRSLAAI